LLQRQLAAVGVDVALEPVKLGELAKRIAKGDFEAHLFRLNGGRSFAPTYRFWHSPVPGFGVMQNTGYSGADDVLERVRMAGSDQETRRAVADLQQRFYEDAPAIFIAWLESTRAVDAEFSVGERSDPDIFANLWRWRPAVRQSAKR
jgi:ABC-type transport system substrate-binding protein